MTINSLVDLQSMMMSAKKSRSTTINAPLTNEEDIYESIIFMDKILSEVIAKAKDEI